ncbi:protein of unknown function [Xenorhabdus poinarii G6]|uniref:Uncharacterized protein n=1 Tax=Xenorhabdus poinarii G6 TaxID=1354304 RepID=A0A068R732_9GAMM|nr:protein of unknown function [Xenorhabdus poinarii G6]
MSCQQKINGVTDWAYSTVVITVLDVNILLNLSWNWFSKAFPIETYC